MKCYSRSLIVGFLLLVCIIGLSVVGTGSVAAQQVDVDATDLPGDGTQENPYMITNASELQAMEDDLDAYYELGSDIDASNTSQWNDGRGFDPIGSEPTYQAPFTGSLEGNNYTVTGLTINRSDDDNTGIGDEDYVGLIGYISSGAASGVTISNISLTNITVTGSFVVGGLVGYNDRGTIQNATATGTVTGSESVGGLIGYNDGLIQNVNATGTVTGSVDVGRSADVGGLVGSNYGSIQNATATGNVSGALRVGGLVGSNGGSIQNTIATGTVNGSADESGSAASDVGGLVGSNGGLIQNAIATGNVTSELRVGGLIGYGSGGTVEDAYWDTGTTGQSSSAGGTGLTTAQMTGQAAVTYMTGLNFDSVWKIQPNDYPMLRPHTSHGDNGSDDSGLVDVAPSDLAGSGTEADPYVITNASELQAMEDNLDAHYEVENNIDASNTAQWNNGRGFDPIGSISQESSSHSPFTGSLDGNNHTLTGLSINRYEDYVGLIRYTNGTISDISLNNTTVTGANFVGGLVGASTGTIQGTTVTGNVTGNARVGGLVGYHVGAPNASIHNATAAGTVTGEIVVGGLVGYNYRGTIRNTTATGTVNGSDYVGGLVGYHKKGHISNTFAVGSVTGSSNVGGLVGLNDDGETVQDSYWDEQTTGQATSAGNATGLTTAQMTGQAAQTNMTGLDFESVWKTQPDDYPALRSQTTDGGGGGGVGGGGISNATATVSGENVTVPPGENATIEFNVTNTGGVNSSYILNLSLPAGLTAVNYTDSGGEQQANESKWLWQTIPSGKTVTPTVTVQTPSDSAETYPVDATVLIDEGVVATTETTVTAGAVSIPEAIDADNNNEIGDMEILTAIEYWQTREPVPGTNGERIGDFEILELIEQWRYNSEI